MNDKLSQKWIKASITGTIWAASEIVLGSFLHNLKIPFSGNILTAIGIIILISLSYTWTEKGLFWRSGLICAIMKTMSPSAVIFGPMIAILSEAFLLEISVRFLGRTFAGYMLGAMMAMSWNLVQKIANYIIFYGSDIIGVYTDLLKLAQKQLNIQTDIVWLPIIILLIIYALFGLLAGITGIRVGRKLLNQPVTYEPLASKKSIPSVDNKHNIDFGYSILWLFSDIILIISSFILLNHSSWWVWSPAIISIIVIWSCRYKRALRQLSKPKFWIFFVFITFLTVFVFTRAQTGKELLKEGLLTGLQMNFRAAIIITGFAVLGTELYNPMIRNFFLKTSFKNLPLALELSVDSLPSFIASIPDFKSLIKNPVSIFYQVISNADKRLAEITGKNHLTQKVFIISGAIGQGKTTFAKRLVDALKNSNIPVGGIISEKVRTESVTIGYDLVDIESGAREVLLRMNDKEGIAKVGKYSIYPGGIQKGIDILNPSNLTDKKVVIIDEVGTLELGNGGWAGRIQDLINASQNHIIMIVRDTLIADVVQKLNLREPFIYKVPRSDLQGSISSIIRQVNHPELS